MIDSSLSDWRDAALRFEHQLNQIIVGQAQAIRYIILAVFARGHVLLEGPVGVGKTTLLKAVAQGLGGDYQRIEGAIDLLPADLLYYTYLDQNGKPRVDAGPLLKQRERLATFFFNEINRARPQVHAVLLRAMAERSVQAFNQVYDLPHLLVFADRNQVEREETFELPAAAKDRFMFEIGIQVPTQTDVLTELMFNTRYHDSDRLVASMPSAGLAYDRLNDIAEAIQGHLYSSDSLRTYALHLWQATHNPQRFGIQLSDVVMEQLIQAGASPRGMSFLIRAAKTQAWLVGRDFVLPEDVQAVFNVTVAHRVFLTARYAYKQEQVKNELMAGILRHIAAP